VLAHRRLIVIIDLVVIAALAAGLVIALNRSTPKVAPLPVPEIHLTTASTEFFVGNGKAGLNCELDDATYNMDSNYRTMAYCQSVTPARSVSMSGSGAAKTCEGIACIGNPGTGTPTFSSGVKVILGPFTCVLSNNWVRCSNEQHSFTLHAVADQPTGTT
jgi:hypothetical protein